MFKNRMNKFSLVWKGSVLKTARWFRSGAKKIIVGKNYWVTGSFCYAMPVTVLAAGSGNIGLDIFTKFMDLLREWGMPILGLGVMGVGGYLMIKGVIGLNKLFWVVAGGVLIAKASSIVHFIFGGSL